MLMIVFFSLLSVFTSQGWAFTPKSLTMNHDGVIVLHASQPTSKSVQIVSSDPNYSGLSVAYGVGGMLGWIFDIKREGEYFLYAYYTSAESRPVMLTVNGETQRGGYFSKNTGNWQAEGLAWEKVGPFNFKRGKNSFQVKAQKFMPHFGGWVIVRQGEKWDPGEMFRNCFESPSQKAEKARTKLLASIPKTREDLRQRIGTDEIVFIKRIPYTSTHYYSEHIDSRWTPGGGIFVLSLKDGKERQIAAELKGGVFGRFDISFDAKRVVFDWKRSHWEGYRIYEVGIAPEEQLDAGGPGARLVLPPPPDEASLVRKYNIDGFHHGTDDMHPCYLPDGGIAFVSTRCQNSTLCHGGDNFTTTLLYRMERDGSKLTQLSFGALSEFSPVVSPDGRILYARWEYVDKGAVSAKCIWSMRPDGTMSAEVYGNDISMPTTMIQPRPIPGLPNRFVILGCPHYPQNALGTVVRLDMDKPIRTTKPISFLTPSVKILLEGGWHFSDLDPGRPILDRRGNGPLFRDPYPLDWDHYMVAHKPRGFGPRYTFNGYGLYTLDSKGKVSPFYYDNKISSWQPMPLIVQKTPPVLRSSISPVLKEKGMAECIVQDVYMGMENTERGSIKYIRILEQVARPWSARRFGHRRWSDSYDQQHAVVSKDTALGVKVQHGIVPVEPDGSARFLVPARANIFFQVLDKNCLAVQTERTFVNFMPGEVRSCIGCHETPQSAPMTPRTLMAMTRPASLPGPQPGEKSPRRILHYPSDVQPVLDRHCIRCHNSKTKMGGMDLTGRMTQHFSVSYENLLPERRNGAFRRDPDLLPTIGENHPKTGNVEYLPARSLGSHNSVLMAMLMPGVIRLQDNRRQKRAEKLAQVHRNLSLKPEELLKISNWVDTNAQYYGSYFGRRNLRDSGHPNFRPLPTWESARGKCPLLDAKR